MKKLIAAIILTFVSLVIFAQYKMRTVDQLINRAEPGWPTVKQWIDSAKNKVEVLPVDTIKAKDVLYKTQVTTRSIMGAIVFSTGGMLIDNGWIRILGSGSAAMQRTLPDWNKGKAFKAFGDPPVYFLVADDAAGGYFAINYGLFGNDVESMYYLSPDNLKWEALNMNYEDFIWFCFTGDLNKFYTGIRWRSWKKDMETLKADEVFHIMPPLWSKEGRDIEKSIKKAVPCEELFSYTLELQKTLGIQKSGN
ncbi:DUF2625 domain-containing protein [Ferruginibacter paludis]|uniref:DUF2625 domain-containing protein n=1 Tax=Ferruginibacter paludis TaxID=1310417 RepID=UPI0025B2EB13|nr:DUF2625 domain-containing protein [Ferruginibacter paludis]MDN3657230.1 DUF2625 domain-containing protein [Ferruginibacter paludis]